MARPSSRRPASQGRGSRGSSKSGRSGNSGRSSRSSSSKNSSAMPIVLGVLGLAVVVVLVIVMGGDDSKKDEAGKKDEVKVADRKVLKNDEPEVKKPEPVKEKSGWRSKYDAATKRKLNALKAKVDMTDWNKADTLYREASKVRQQALDARKAKNEKEFEVLIAKALKIWREGEQLSDNWVYNLSEYHEDLWDACFNSEEKIKQRMMREFRPYLRWEK